MKKPVTVHASDIRIARKYTNESCINTFVSRDKLWVCIEGGYVMITVVIMLPPIFVSEDSILLKNAG